MHSTPIAAATPVAATPSLRGKRITVMGLGRFGGGAGVTRWLREQNAQMLVTDVQPREALREPLNEISDLIEEGTVRLRLGEHVVSDFTSCDLVIANPAVPQPWHNQFIGAARNAGVPVTTEMRLLTERINRQRVIGITGSAGKSTTTAMIHHILVNAGFHAHLGGNIGGSLLTSLDEMHADDWIVLELSSAMLHWLGAGVGYEDARGWSPRTAVLTNITPNHIDWHGSFEHYQQSKLNIFKYQSQGDQQVTTDHLPRGRQPIPLQIPGSHNQINAQLALAAVERAVGLPQSRARSLLADFPGLPHRLQLVAQAGDQRFYNDSKSTTPEATVLAVAAFDDPKRVHLIAGGYDKGSDLTPIAQLGSRIGGLYTIGNTGRDLAESATAGAFAEYCESLDAAVKRAKARMRPKDVLLLSPGCASWDQFTNYEKRGEMFVKLIENLNRAEDHS